MWKWVSRWLIYVVWSGKTSLRGDKLLSYKSKGHGASSARIQSDSIPGKGSKQLKRLWHWNGRGITGLRSQRGERARVRGFNWFVQSESIFEVFCVMLLNNWTPENHCEPKYWAALPLKVFLSYQMELSSVCLWWAYITVDQIHIENIE